MIRAYEEPRWVLARVRPEMICRLFDAADIPRDHVRLPRFKDLPEGYEVLDVHLDQLTRCFLFRLYHPTWPIVPDGEPVPSFDAGQAVEIVTVPRKRPLEADTAEPPKPKCEGPRKHPLWFLGRK